jgi:Domain of unknown function (DUF1995)
MFEVPKSLEEATTQAQAATQAAIQDGLGRLQVEMVIPELKQQPIAEQFLTVFQTMGLQFKVYFPDAGAAALAKRDWGNPDFSIRGLQEIKDQMAPEDEAFLVVNPSSVEVLEVEKLCEAALDRPVVLLNPQMEDIAIVGIGYTARQIRERFLSTLNSCYYFRPFEGAAVFRCYPQPWQIWRETAPNRYELVAELAQKPSGEAIEEILYGKAKATDGAADPSSSQVAKPKKSFLGELQQMLRALSN